MTKFNYHLLLSLKDRRISTNFKLEILKGRNQQMHKSFLELNTRGLIYFEPQANEEELNDWRKIPYHKLFLTKEGYEIVEAWQKTAREHLLIKIQIIIGIISIITSIISIYAMVMIGYLTAATS